ncbi:uncharacterized protein LOC135209444 [Macrobrachium nipponense]|uniref:uncharacterized protein LOC135209444 n=1 Tax=Macrobrachium nipponense TaxID=159736 RepID=UPI0030C7CE38
MRQISRLLLLLSFISLNSSAQSESAVQTTSNGQPAFFRLSNNAIVVIGFRTEHPWPRIKYTVSDLGKEILKGKFNSFEWTSQWIPLIIDTKVINGANLEDPQGLDTRYVSLSSTEEVQWLMMTLPLKDHELQKATPGEEVLLDLPEEDDVWVAFWNKLGREFRTELVLINEQKTYQYLNISTSKDWSIICINDERILYGNNYYAHPLSNKGLKGRRLQMKATAKFTSKCSPFL